MSDVTEVEGTPNLTRLYAKAVVTSLQSGSQLPDETLARSDVAVDRSDLAAYNRVCGFGVADTLPPTYPHVLAFPLAMQLMARASFPLPLPGLVHIRNTITQHRALIADEPLTVRVRVEGLRPHPKGRQFDIVSFVEADDEVVWEETSTILQRGSSNDDADAGLSLERDDLRDSASWQVAKDMGRRYAGVSGDVNPIHLYPLSARLFGFSRPIANGMWTKARAVAALADRLPAACTIDVEFRKPLLVPATVTFATRELDDGWAFAVRSRSGSAHLYGRARSTGS